MEMHMALAVDGNTFVQTGYRFLVLPNSQQQVALPFWELQPTPVRLFKIPIEGESYGLLGIEINSDQYLATLSGDSIAIRVWNEGEGDFLMGDFSVDFNCTPDMTEVFSTLGNIPASIALPRKAVSLQTNSCSISEGSMTTKWVLTADEYTMEYPTASYIAGSFFLNMTDWQYVE